MKKLKFSETFQYIITMLFSHTEKRNVIVDKVYRCLDCKETVSRYCIGAVSLKFNLEIQNQHLKYLQFSRYIQIWKTLHINQHNTHAPYLCYSLNSKFTAT